jgi:protein disulfide-isomerase A1
MGTFFFSNAI